jgi:hypothetical protein
MVFSPLLFLMVNEPAFWYQVGFGIKWLEKAFSLSGARKKLNLNHRVGIGKAIV